VTYPPERENLSVHEKLKELNSGQTVLLVIILLSWIFPCS
jgi:hypothetical protein